jgi:hypothetical protein
MKLVPPTHLITVSQAMTLASSTESAWNSIFQNTAGIVFLGTPHRGSSSASGPGFFILSFLSHILCCLSPPPFLSLLRANSPSLARTADEFNDVWGSRRISSFCETKAMVCGKLVIQHSTFLQHLSQQLLLSDCPQERCDHKLSRRADT